MTDPAPVPSLSVGDRVCIVATELSDDGFFWDGLTGTVIDLGYREDARRIAVRFDGPMGMAGWSGCWFRPDDLRPIGAEGDPPQ